VSQINELLKQTVERGASDLHISSGHPPCIRVDGEMIFLNEHPVLSPETADDMLGQVLPQKNKRELEELWDTDCGYAIEGIGRFRVNAFCDLSGSGAVFRVVPEKVPTLEELNIGYAGILCELCMHTKGLIILTGPTGSGKSTTLAAMLDFINRTRTEHIITIEDPIEFVHTSRKCLINQRAIHHHTRSFSGALRAALREDPDIILLGEMRDLETTEIALETAETGHLVLATLHTNTATSTVDRIIDKFPAGRQNQIRTLLASTLTGVIAQTLCKRMDGGRVAAAEVLIANQAVRSNIRDQKTHQLPTAIQTGQNIGMRSFTDSLYQLVEDGIIGPREAYLKAVDKTSLEQKFTEKGIQLDKTPTELPAPDLVHSLDLHDVDMDSPAELKELAWKLSTDRNSQARNGEKALVLIERAIELAGENAEALMIYAAALAEKGDFKGAVQVVKKAIPAAKQEKDVDCLRELQQHLTCYKKSRPHPGSLF
jgi:twitching motility protein PilT